jgi:hypothetical protein
VLVLTSPSAPFSTYYAEILQGEGLNEFDVAGLGSLTPALLGSHHVVILGEGGLTDAQVAALTDWVQAGGNLIAMRPDAKLGPLLGLGPDAGDLGEGYIKVDTGAAPGAGITGDTMQFHGIADRHGLSAGTQAVATLYTNATTPTSDPAVTLRSVGPNGGQAAAFTYDLARSVVYTRQGNPAWAGQKRDGQIDPIRSDDLFFGGTQTDWVNLAKVAIPQADEQQRLLANLVTQMSADRMPLPRFWYLPRGEKAAVVLTGDDHANGGTRGQFERYLAESTPGCSVAAWECIRSTSYVFPGTPITNAEVSAWQNAGFEIALHLTTGCGDFTRSSLRDDWDGQLPEFESNFPSAAAPRTNRTHCIAWSDWASEPIVERENGVRLDTNYYYWPGAWVQNRPGMFTGSGFPQRFADQDGSLIDVYQATTQLTDESNIDIAQHIKALIDNSTGALGYYGVFTANMHTDNDDNPGADDIIAEATSRGVPVISASQLLTWLDGRNDSSFGGLGFTGNQLSFSVQRGAGATGLEAMVPTIGPTGAFTNLFRNGSPVATTLRSVKGVDYRVFDAVPGGYVATYGSAPPVDTSIASATVTGSSAVFTFAANQFGATFECALDAVGFAPCTSPASYSGLPEGTHTFRVRAIVGGVADPTPAQTAITIGSSGGGGTGGQGSGGSAGSPASKPGPETGASGVTPGAADRKAPRITLTPRLLRLSPTGFVRLRVACPRDERRCRVQLRLRLRGRYVASKTLTVTGGRTRVFALKLRAAARSELAQRRALALTAVAVASDSAGNRVRTTTAIRLLAPARR